MTGVDAMLARRRRVRKRWIAVIGLTVLIAGASVVGLHRAADSEPGTPREAYQQYLDAIVERDGERAWDLLCRTEQKRWGPEEHFVADFNSPSGFLDRSPRKAGQAVPFEPFPVEAWRVETTLVIREGENLRLCGDPQYLYEDRDLARRRSAATGEG